MTTQKPLSHYLELAGRNEDALHGVEVSIAQTTKELVERCQRAEAELAAIKRQQPAQATTATVDPSIVNHLHRLSVEMVVVAKSYNVQFSMYDWSCGVPRLDIWAERSGS